MEYLLHILLFGLIVLLEFYLLVRKVSAPLVMLWRGSNYLLLSFRKNWIHVFVL